ncbi:TolC family protein [Desulfosoma caldarium]|uniref:Outer membrane protein TolC n=1 Tax=Desulfosoma caldarium TaxID=610254 RepID=A0A3N1VTX6_9BACT|nr:TolC family protein [Desulfosoma caldarium]ROR03227.1 outer membrane protein TolC [Desulfosoma caldarium]
MKHGHDFIRPWVALLLLLSFVALDFVEAFAKGSAAAAETSPQGPAVTLPAVLDLKTAQRLALQSNPSLQAAQARVAQARERVRQAWSRYLPRVEGTASASHVRSPQNQEQTLPSSKFSSTTSGIFYPEREDIYRAALNATLTLFDGFQREFALAAARFSEQGSQAAYREAQRVLLRAVADSYFQAQLARQRRLIAQADEAFNERQLKDAQARETLGAGSLSDVLNFQVQVNLARSQKIQAEQEERVALTGLAALMGLAEGTLSEHTTLAALQEPNASLLQVPSIQKALDEATQYRPDLEQARFALRAAQANVGSAKSRFFPSFNLFSTLEGSRANDGHFQADDFGSSIGIALVVPLFSGGEDVFRVREAEQSRREAQRTLQQAIIEAASEVQAAVEQILSAQQQFRLQKETAALVEKTRNLVDKEYAAGQASLVRLTQAQRDLVLARSQLAQSRIALESAWIRLRAATGRILDDF